MKPHCFFAQTAPLNTDQDGPVLGHACPRELRADHIFQQSQHRAAGMANKIDRVPSEDYPNMEVSIGFLKWVPRVPLNHPFSRDVS